MSEWNDNVIAEFRANDGKVEAFGDAPMALLHHVGRKSGKEFVAPLRYFTEDTAPGVAYVIASAAGAPKHPQWYENLVAAGHATVELATPSGIETVETRVEDLAAADRDRVWAQVVAEAPGFGDYADKTEGIRTIPVLALHRSDR